MARRFGRMRLWWSRPPTTGATEHGRKHLDKHPIADLDYDAIVVGARVAGSTLAALLGDAGHRVLLIDRASFPSPTLSTHYFRGGRAVSVLKRLGVLDEVLDL